MPATGDNEPWRASTRLQTVLFTLRAHVRQRDTMTGQVPADRWNLLRHTQASPLRSATGIVYADAG